MVARTLLIVTLYVHCLFCLFWPLSTYPLEERKVIVPLVTIHHTHTHTHTHSVELLWAKDRPVVERPLPDNTQHSQQTHIHAPGGILIRSPSKWGAGDPFLRARWRWDRPVYTKGWKYPNDFINYISNIYRPIRLLSGSYSWNSKLCYYMVFPYAVCI